MTDSRVELTPPTDMRRVRVRAKLPARVGAAIALTAAALFAASASVAVSGEVPEAEADVLRFINGWPDQLEPLFWAIQQVGVLGAPALGGLLLAWWGRCRAYAVPFLLLIPVKLGIEWLLLKQLIERGRPLETIGDEIEVRGPAIDGLGFPSGHATTAMAFAVLLAAFVPARWRPALVAWAVLVGVARLFYGEHNPLDIVAGLAIGAIYGVALWWLLLDRLAQPTEGRA